MEGDEMEKKSRSKRYKVEDVAAVMADLKVLKTEVWNVLTAMDRIKEDMVVDYDDYVDYIENTDHLENDYLFSGAFNIDTDDFTGNMQHYLAKLDAYLKQLIQLGLKVSTTTERYRQNIDLSKRKT